MGILSGYPKDEPLHYGEVFTIWSHLMLDYGMIAGFQTFYNHTGDGDLKKFIEDVIQVVREEVKVLEKILKSNGIGLPIAPPERPVARLEDIPPGARFNDPEISAAISADIAAGLVACSGHFYTRRYCINVWSISFSEGTARGKIITHE